LAVNAAGKRKKLFMITLVWYMACTVLTAFSWDFLSFAFFRMLAGAGIGGEYSAVNSAIDELIPSGRRGVADIAINGSRWIGTLLGSVLSIPLLDGRFVVTYFTPIINAPEVACKAETRPVWDGSAFVPRLIQPLSLSYDHRVIDGALAARFTVEIKNALADLRRTLL
jgi:MFS family permease